MLYFLSPLNLFCAKRKLANGKRKANGESLILNNGHDSVYVCLCRLAIYGSTKRNQIANRETQTNKRKRNRVHYSRLATRRLLYFLSPLNLFCAKRKLANGKRKANGESLILANIPSRSFIRLVVFKRKKTTSNRIKATEYWPSKKGTKHTWPILFSLGYFANQNMRE